MKELRKQKLFVNVVCNVLLLCVISVFALVYYLSGKSLTLETANSEYNGTIYAGDKSSNNVSLMINVYWGTEHLEKMLEIFEKKGIKTTFFVGGTWAKDNSELLKKMFESGHEIASHGTNHKEQGKLSYEGNFTEIQTCHEIVKHILNIDMELFAPPGGSYNSFTTKSAEMLGYKTIMWTRDTIDWRDKNTSLIFNRAVTNMCGGDLILMHPTANTVEALSNIIDYAENHGFKLTTVSETLGLFWWVTFYLNC